MKCKSCCFYTIVESAGIMGSNSKTVCVRNPPAHMKDAHGNYNSLFPRPKPGWWCGEWKPIGFIKMWPDNLTKEFDL